MNKINQLKEAIKDLYSSVAKLRAVFPGKPFTPDGRIVGDIGEAIAALKFNVVLDRKLRRDWDGYRIDSSGKKCEVQVKTTQKDETYLKKPPHEGDLIVFKIFDNGEWECCYDGKIMRVWNSLAKQKLDSTGAKFIQLARLRNLNKIAEREK
ncbi:hypothetical protein A2926_00090 [Candidatus Giovannonibacteria bacterium RIFCSPLOWO2_01_FULL_44_40]|uniref:DUF6998 domain-containing protein n=1 Tax=Candidatus Giovannonibacteria bacterium RIFCSPHIGHO2_01_FULL_45_23 TaxID=1798325 RepID=A0A1F5VFL0_9BACT|nr:MAG: hypothetical protein A2834_01045 [Candidatus Giovannonibacteria bacterium RIFCSPHIGHO2_01_FULL_45_23]OGF75311.1 MAG: hypothetical protein A3C77_01255 [Candidatus Giovannonibacteria bacterium RIFCSPHIGHO2_02_FULL_45_13]OGF79695.1 MAG: hypothetical protein A2926_00090 [Candidatus Giovannonibacteria bacterium RIFCSPLOWO2_01_FULL_44_40]